jgi:preprotein translocase subunit SecG
MITFIAIILIIVSILLMFIVLIQNPKGGGIAANFSNIPTQLMGAKQTTDIVEKLTWGFAVTILVLSLSTNFFRPEASTGIKNESKLNEKLETKTLPAAPAPAQQPAK